MRPLTHNGFVLRYAGPVFPATHSNEITYEYFCLMGGLANDRLHKVQWTTRKGVYETYHRIDKR